ncbi:hypothetical protein TNCV_2806031 [Trichonephila clavipes]|nr:hypothetical protein TNCV_2806031 [Trichonephila clavipes]
MNQVVLTEYNGDQMTREMRERHNKEVQFNPEKAEKVTIIHTSKSEQDQATRIPDEEVINHGKTRKGEERVQRNPCHWRSCSFFNPTPLAHADTSRDVLPRGDKPGLIHVLYHEIDTGDQGPLASRPYSRPDRYDRVKQGIIDYRIEEILKEVTIWPIQSPYASPVVLTPKNNGLPTDSPEA